MINNAFYDELDEAWYSAREHPIALLRAEARLRNAWVIGRLQGLGRGGCRVLDVGCGAGLLANELASAGYQVAGVDRSERSLETARRHDATGTVRYLAADAYELPFADSSFDAVCAMDFLEHVEEPARVIAQLGRVLAPGGLCFLYTFNRTLWSWLLVIKGVEWFVRNVPKDMHLHSLFLRPQELDRHCGREGLLRRELLGVRPAISGAFWKLLLTGRVADDFAFVFTPSLQTGYLALYLKPVDAAR